MPAKILILGGDGIKWAMDKDALYLAKALEELGYSLTNRFLAADVIYTVLWNKVLALPRRAVFLRKILKKNIIATIPNDLAHQGDDLRRAIPLVDHWVYFNDRQKQDLLAHGVPLEMMSYNPPYFDETIFRRLDGPRAEIAQSIGLDAELLRDRFVVGSFQRDSLGTDLSKPKWQKNPDMLIDLFRQLDRERFLLLLAGPRRHYLISRCRELSIPYVYLGDMRPVENGIDDIGVNVLPLETMNRLYNLVDCYVVGSKSEGTPYAVIETCLNRTAIVSTDVGVVPDFLDPWCIYREAGEAAGKIMELERDPALRDRIVERNYRRGIEINNAEAYRERVRQIVEKVV